MIFSRCRRYAPHRRNSFVCKGTKTSPKAEPVCSKPHARTPPPQQRSAPDGPDGTAANASPGCQPSPPNNCLHTHPRRLSGPVRPPVPGSRLPLAACRDLRHLRRFSAATVAGPVYHRSRPAFFRFTVASHACVLFPTPAPPLHRTAMKLPACPPVCRSATAAPPPTLRPLPTPSPPEHKKTKRGRSEWSSPACKRIRRGISRSARNACKRQPAPPCRSTGCAGRRSPSDSLRNPGSRACSP